MVWGAKLVVGAEQAVPAVRTVLVQSAASYVRWRGAEDVSPARPEVNGLPCASWRHIGILGLHFGRSKKNWKRKSSPSWSGVDGCLLVGVLKRLKTHIQLEGFL